MIIIFDTETTGLPNKLVAALEAQPKIIEVGILVCDDNFKITQQFAQVLDPQQPLDKKITEITGLTDSDVAGCPTFPAIYTELCNLFLGVGTMIAHNLHFDKTLLRYELMRMDKEFNFPWPPTQVCTVESTMGIKSYRLSMEKLWRELFNEDKPTVHRALEDCLHLHHICIELRKRNLI